MRTLIRWFDQILRWSLGVFEFSDDPEGLLRVRRTTAGHPVTLPGRDIPAAAPVLELHMWNEHVPPLPATGPDLAWAVQSRRRLKASLRELALQIRRDPSFASVQAVRGVTVLAFAADGAEIVNLFERLGFTIRSYRNPLGRFGEFWENLYTWAIMWAFNEASLSRRRLPLMRRSEIWMTAEAFLQRYGMQR